MAPRMTRLLIALAVLSLSDGSRAAPPRRPPAPLALVGYAYRSDGSPVNELSLGGAWRSGRGWAKAPRQRFGSEWRATDWQLFHAPDAPPVAMHTNPAPHPADVLGQPYYDLIAPAPTGVAVSRVSKPRPRLARREPSDRPELRESTRQLLMAARADVPDRFLVREAWRVDLIGDGRDEVLWTARSREEWNSPYREGPEDPGRMLPGDFALLGMRYLDGGRVRAVALALESEKTGSAAGRYLIFTPLDLNGDGLMEIMAHGAYWEEDELLAFSFDGSRVAGILGTAPAGCSVRDERPALNSPRPNQSAAAPPR